MKLYHFSKSFWVMFYCLFAFTIWQFVPVYFTNNGIRCIYYVMLFCALMLALAIQLSRYIKKKGRVNYYWSYPFAFLIAALLVIVFGVLTLSTFLGTWTEATILYTRKNNDQIKIVSRYFDLGAFGGGTSPNDYQIVLHRPLTPLFKMETSVDTTKIAKDEWLRSR